MFTKWWTANSSSLKRGLKPACSVLLCGTLLIAAAGCALLPKEDDEEVLPPINPPKLSEKPAYPVKTDTLETVVRGTGRLMSMKEEELFFTDNGKRVKDVYVQPGEHVEAGQVLAELDVTDQQSQLKQQELQSRKDELAMIETLRKADQMSAEQLEQAKIDFELKRQSLTKLQDEIERAKLKAPFAGNVASIYVKKGDTVNAYDTVAVIADLSQLTVAARITNEDDLAKVSVGMEATVDINGYKNGSLKGTVLQLPNPQQSQNGNIPRGPNGGVYGGGGSQQQKDTIDNYLIVKLDPFPQGLNRGTPLGVSIVVDRKENAVVIPKAALRSYAGRNYVQVKDDDGTKREVDVEVGQQTSTEVEILKGLTPGQKVVGK
jgi:macrolide-specific efflux system membrane fusion protein